MGNQLPDGLQQHTAKSRDGGVHTILVGQKVVVLDEISCVIFNAQRVVILV